MGAECQLGAAQRLLLKDLHTSSSHAVPVLIYVIIMNIYIWELSQWAPRYTTLTMVEQEVSVSLPVECSCALWLILITGSTVSPVLPPPSLCPLQNSSILPDITLLGSSLSPTPVSCLRHFPNLPLACLLELSWFSDAHLIIQLCPPLSISLLGFKLTCVYNPALC